MKAFAFFLPGLALWLTACNETVKTVPLTFTAPRHFLSADVEKAYPTSKAIPNLKALNSIEGAKVEIEADPNAFNAQVRLIRLPAAYHANQKAAEALAACGAIQDGDTVIVFRPEWARTTGYGNVQLGMGHAGLAFVDEVNGVKMVQTVESPLNYSSHLDYPGHYAGHDMFHIVRPNLTSAQKKNVVAWARLILANGKDHLTFFDNYGMPYFIRGTMNPAEFKDPKTLSVDLAKTVAYKQGKLGSYCSELIWAVYGLRDIDPNAMLSTYPTYDAAKVDPFLVSKVTPFFSPMPAATSDPINNPGLMQGPDVVLRHVYPPAEDEDRRKFILTEVLVDRAKKPSDFQGIMSEGHIAAGKAFAPKIQQLREYYDREKESAAYLTALNAGIPPNYSPSSFFILANSNRKGADGKKLFNYVGTVSFRPDPNAVVTPEPAPAPPTGPKP